MTGFREDANSVVRLDGTAVPVAVTVYDQRIVRVRIGERQDGAMPSFLAEASWTPRPATVNARTIESGEVALALGDDAGVITFCDRQGHERIRLSLADAELGARVRVRFQLVGEQHLYGLGQSGLSFDRLGTTRRLWNCHVNHSAAAADIAIPLLVSNAGFGLFFDDPNPGFVRPGDSPEEIWAEFDTTDRALDVYYLAGGNMRHVMAGAAELLGQAPMPPRWALGFMQSSRHFESADEVRALGRTLREKRLPCDALIFLSTYGDGKGWNIGVGHLDFEPGLFADGAEVLRGFQAQDFRVITHEYPVLHPESPLFGEAAAKGYLLDDGYADITPTERPTVNFHEGQRYIDFSRHEVRRWWWASHRHLVELGVAGWWLDGGEGPLPETRSASGAVGLHNRFDVLRHEAFAEGEATDRPDGRAFLLCRSGGAGLQRFGAGCWSGDINRTFPTLEAQVALGLGMGLSGVPLWGTDVGGFYPVTPPDGELFARWFQFGAFTPIFRAHGWTWREHVPWAYGTAIEAICREYIELRYRLVPYTYTLARQAHVSGLPMMRPLVLNYPGDANSWECASEYLWGDDILVAPVTRSGARRWPVYLPAGGWYDFWTGKAFAGPGGIEVDAPVERLPLLVRAGAIVPMGPVVQHLAGYAPATLTVLFYPYGSSSFTLYEDDGETQAYRDGGHVETLFTCDASAGLVVCRVSVAGGDPRLLPQDRNYVFRVRAPERPRSVLLDGSEAREWRHDGVFVEVDVPGHPAELRMTW